MVISHILQAKNKKEYVMILFFAPTISLGIVINYLLTILRELSIKNGKLYQQPIRELENMHGTQVKYENITFTDVLKLVSYVPIRQSVPFPL